MSSPDSFLAEVAEEVRRDRLNLFVRRYGWIVVLAVLAIVAAVGAWEWRKSQVEAQAQALGDSFLAALEPTDPQARVQALSEIDATGEAAILRDLLAAGELSAADSRAAADRLRAIIGNEAADPLLRDVARLRIVALPETVLTSDERIAMLSPMIDAAGPFRLAALELRATAYMDQNATDKALADLAALAADAQARPDQRQRATQLTVALGGKPEGM